MENRLLFLDRVKPGELSSGPTGNRFPISSGYGECDQEKRSRPGCSDHEEHAGAWGSAPQASDRA